MHNKSITNLDTAINALGNKWTLQIIKHLLVSNKRFNQLQRDCDICPRTLSSRLDDLELQGIVTKKFYSSKSKKAEYSLTGKGKSLNSVISAIDDWSRSI